METFSRGVLSTPKLQKVEIDGCDIYGCWDDLSSTIKQSQKMVAFPDMKGSKLTSLKESAGTLWDIHLPMSTSSSHHNITNLILEGFENLKYVFPSSLVKSFDQLQQLEIRDCAVLKEIVTTEEVETTSTFVFPRVTVLKLENLPELTSFYPRKHMSEWPVLRILEVYNCEKVKTFTSEHLRFQADNEEAYSLLLVEKINPNLEVLGLSEIDTVMTWQDPLSENFFCKLKRLTFLKSANVPLGIFQRFKNLEMLKLHEIQSKEILLCVENEEAIGMPTHIKGLELDNCDDLEYLWKQDSKVASILQNLEVLEVYRCSKLINVVSSSASFQSLKVVSVKKCHGMVNLMTSSTAKSLVQLTEMKIQRCDFLTEIVENDQDGVEDEIIFTKLKWLSLEDLDSLTCFYSGKHTFRFLSLEELIVEDCPNMKTFCEGVLSTSRLQKVRGDKFLNLGRCLEGELNTIIQHLHEDKVHSNLEKLTISGKDITPTWLDHFSSHDFGKVESLEFIKDESTNIPIEIFQRFNNFEKLILKVGSYQEIVSCGKDDMHARILSQIKFLEVHMCCKLTTLMPPSASFENLTTLDVGRCDGLRNLVSFGTAKNLKQLKNMTIRLCQMMTEIVANEGDVENDEFVFSKLKSLRIEDLKSFTCFYSGNCTFKFPSLRRMDVFKCPKMKTFCGGVLRTPCLQWVSYDEKCLTKWDLNEINNWDLNEIIQQSHKKDECLEL